MTILKRFAVMILLSLSVAAAESVGTKRSPSAEQIIQWRWAEIGRELKQVTSHEWAGQYHGWEGVSLMLAPAEGFAFEWMGCCGIYDENYGSVNQTNSRLHLSFRLTNGPMECPGISSELIPVAWGSREYLVPADDVIGFCNDVNTGAEPRQNIYLGHYLLRGQGEKQVVSGFPNIPDEYRPYLLNHPVEGRIIAVEPHVIRQRRSSLEERVVSVTLNVGKADGILPGMQLYVFSPEIIFESVRIKSVTDKTSLAEIKLTSAKENVSMIGWKVSTRLAWKR